MNCPKCREKGNLIDVAGLKVFECGRCEGLWFDFDQLCLLVEKDPEDYAWSDIELWRDPAKFSIIESAGACPNDSASLTSLEYLGAPCIIEICPDCMGVWLDREQYDDLVDYLDMQIDPEFVAEAAGDAHERYTKLFTSEEAGKTEESDLAKVMYMLQLRFGIESATLKDVREIIRSGAG